MPKTVTDNQTATREAAMSKLSSQMDALKYDRSSLFLQIEQIDQKLSTLRSEYGAIYNVSSSLLNLPAEITCIIFDYAASPPPNYGVDSPLYRNYETDSQAEEKESKMRAEVVLSHVCKRWRDVALNYPRLWTRFFYWEDSHCSDQGVASHRLATYLNRSGTQSLELFFDFSYGAVGFITKPAEDDERLMMLDLALAHVARWQVVTIRAEFILPVTRRLRTLSNASAPKLEYFTFCPDVSEQRRRPALQEEEQMAEEAFDSTNALNLQPTIFKNGAPKLSYLHIDGSGSILPPLSNITTLRIEAEGYSANIGFTWPAMLEIFAIPTLANLSIVGNVFESPPAFEGLPLITMNNLKHLRYSENDHMTLILPYLRLPSLESLALRNIWMPEELGITIPIPATKPAYFFPSLKSLTLIDSSASTLIAARYFMHLTKLTQTFFLSVEDPDENILAVLMPFLLKKECWPKLSTLILNLSSEDEIELITSLTTNANRPKKSVKVCLLEDLKLAWLTSEPHHFQMLDTACELATLKRPTPGKGDEGEQTDELKMLRPVWPPGCEGVYPPYLNNDDPFEADTDFTLGY